MSSADIPVHLLLGCSVLLAKLLARITVFGALPLGSQIIAPVILGNKMWVGERRMETCYAGSQVSLNIWMEMNTFFCRTLGATDSQGVVGFHSWDP